MDYLFLVYVMFLFLLCFLSLYWAAQKLLKKRERLPVPGIDTPYWDLPYGNPQPWPWWLPKLGLSIIVMIVMALMFGLGFESGRHRGKREGIAVGEQVSRHMTRYRRDY